MAALEQKVKGHYMELGQSEYFSQPEQREEAVCLVSADNRLVLRQQVGLVQTWWRQSFLVQKSHQHLHRVPASKRGGVIDRVRLWLCTINDYESQKHFKHQQEKELLKNKSNNVHAL